jgi:predicted permease
MAGKDASVQAVTGNYFNMLGGGICMGRPILESDDGPGSGVAVASYAAWKRRLGANPEAVGTKLYLRGRPVEVVGVACPEFNGLEERRVDFWVSLAHAWSATDNADVFGPEAQLTLTVVGRLKPGVTMEGAEASLLAYGQQMSPTWQTFMTYPVTGATVREPYHGKPPRTVTLRQAATVLPLDRDSIGSFMPMFAAFGLILLIACANVANMMLARGLARQREIGIRISLGAGRGRMIRQLLTESLLLALPAALAAFVVAQGTIQAALWLQVNVLHADQRWSLGLWNAAPDLRVLAFLMATAGIATLGFGLMPAIQASRSRLVEANRGEFATDYRPARLRSALVVAQVTLCALLLILAGVTLRSERRIASQNLGVDARGVFTVTINRSMTADKQFRQPAMERLLSLPRTAALGVCSFPLGSGSMWANVVSGNGTIGIPYNLVSPEYFGVYGIALR